jgi:ferredoxin-nitrate reductase
MTKGRPCDYSGMSYEMLRGGNGIQWPCNDDAPDGTERLYTDFRFRTSPDDCEDYGHDFLTGAAFEKADRAALRPEGRAILRAAEYRPPSEAPDDDYPLRLSTGRTVYHFHTRTKTGRVRELRDAEPEPWVELAERDAAALGVADGDWVRVVSRRGALEAPARVRGNRDGAVFVPFHYGYWDESSDGATPDDWARAANELTITQWDPVSKQPLLKAGAVRVERLERNRSEPTR